jgi:hypothetical protein
LRIVVNPPPTLLLHCGKFVHDAMRRQRVAEADVRAAVRRQGIARIEDVGAVILEPDGTFSVVKELEPNASALADIPELGGSTSANRPTGEPLEVLRVPHRTGTCGASKECLFGCEQLWCCWRRGR